MQPPLERNENWRDKKIEIGIKLIFLREETWSFFEEFSITKPGKARKIAPRRDADVRCVVVVHAIFLGAIDHVIKRIQVAGGESRSVPEVVPGSRRVSRDRRPRSRDISFGTSSATRISPRELCLLVVISFLLQKKKRNNDVGDPSTF